MIANIFYNIFVSLQHKQLLNGIEYPTQVCNSKLNDKIIVQYCFKAVTLASQVQSSRIIQYQQQQVYHSLYTEKTQDLKLDLIYSMDNLPSFALFGLTTNVQISYSTLSILVPQLLLKGSLVCFVCDFNTSTSEFMFVAHAQNLSGIVFCLNKLFDIKLSLIQFRLEGVHVGGLIFDSSKITISLQNCNISEYISHQSTSGSLIAYINEIIVINSDNVKICVNFDNYVGVGIDKLSITHELIYSCDVCRDSYYTYGLCLRALNFTIIEGNNQLVCLKSFVFDGMQCSCLKNQHISGSKCVNTQEIIESKQNRIQSLEFSASIMQDQISQLQYSLNKLLQQVECNVKHGFAFVQNVCTFDFMICMLDTDVYVISFDVSEVTNHISKDTDFSKGFIFDSQTLIQNAFVDISDKVYLNDVQPLFESQNTFTNLKIQLGVQSFNSGSLILQSSISINVNMMKIISRYSSLLTVNTGCQLNMFTSSTQSTNIRDMIVNVSFAASNGNITLIGSIDGLFNISKYQVYGIYISTLTVSMIGISIEIATVNVNYVKFQPSIYNTGNGSSYLFGNSNNTQIVFVICNVVVIIGNSSNFLILGSISTTGKYPDYYNFGGIIVYINSSASVTLNNIIMDSYQQFITKFVELTGFLIGYADYNSTSIKIINICLQQNVMADSTSNTFLYFGLIGFNSGNASLQNLSVVFSVQNMDVQYFGILGSQQSRFFRMSCLYVEVINLRASVNVKEFDTRCVSGSFVGSIFGSEEAQNCSIQNTSVTGGNINQCIVGGFIGNLAGNITITSSSITNVNLSTKNQYVGGFVGFCMPQLTIQLANSQIQFVRIYSQDYSNIRFGIIVGRSSECKFTCIGSFSTSNYINDVLQNDCAVITSLSDTGC
ncbi:Hypothetical_protein [Hexamita inflata]|uniref:Hypothetical_protein n=1 Tax=Hexamita inflata TaxID=28002 RepID=A0ABP1JFK7_9EUKA